MSCLLRRERGASGRQVLRLGLAVMLLAVPAVAHAEPPDGGSTVGAPLLPVADDADAGSPPADLSAISAELAAQRKEIELLKAEAEASKKTLVDLDNKTEAASAGEGDWTHRFRLYGFTDVGLNRVWVDPSSRIGQAVSGVNATSFVVGNLDLYLDAQPVKGWRSLVEIRFTSAPHGEISSYGGIAGAFKRTSTMQADPNSSSIGAQLWGGYTVIERAHVDWTDRQLFKVRVGNFFTPFGIWNVDHGTPTLIAVQLPGVIQLRQMPLRQTGVQIYGNGFAGDWELGYAATVSNGRQELSNFAFDDNRGFGGRLSANNEKGDLSVRLGASFYTGRVRDDELDVLSASPLKIEHKRTFDYREIVGGLDAAVDIGRTRLRAEGAISSVRYEDGKHEVQDRATGALQPNRIVTTAYALVAHTLPFVPIEPYATADVVAGPAFGMGNLLVGPSLGVNVRFTKATMLKTQVTHSFAFDTGDMSSSDVRRNNFTSAYSRLVLVF